MATRYRKRLFLNKDRSLRAYAIAHVDKLSTWEGQRGINTDLGATLELGDCSKTIYLNFDISTPKEKANVLHKARVLRDLVNTFLDEVEAEAGRSDFRPVKKEKKDAAPKKNS